MQDLIIKYLPTLTHLNRTSDNFGVIVDTETTSLNPDAQLLEFTALKFYFDNDLKIIGFEQPVTMLNEPSCPIDPDSSKVTGITLEDVKGHEIRKEDVEALLDGAAIVVAHNARFDRNALERNLDIKNYYWACSINDIDWFAQGITGKTQEFIAFKYGFWYNAHRAEEDCYSLLNILERGNNFNELFNKAFTETFTVAYYNTPFASKDVLKQAGGRWDPDGKFWYFERVEDVDSLRDMEKNLGTFEKEVFAADFSHRFKG